MEDTLAGSGWPVLAPWRDVWGCRRSPLAETVARCIQFSITARDRAQVHICRRSSSEGIELVRQASEMASPVTADLAIHHVHLIDVDIGYFDPNFRLDLRCAAHGIATRSWPDSVTERSTHLLRPCADRRRRQTAAVGELNRGDALETLLSLTLKWATENNVPLVQALGKVTSAPAAVLGKGSAKGRLSVGAKADVVVFDPSAHWLVGAETLTSAGKNTPFTGYELEGRVRFTLVGGEVRYEAASTC